MTGRTSERRIAFVLVGGTHQFLHGLPVAAELSRRPGMRITCYVNTAQDAAVLAEMMAELGAGPYEAQVMTVPGPTDYFTNAFGRPLAFKALRLLWWAWDIRRADAIVTLERTSTMLRMLPGRCPPLIHIPHGVGGARRSGGGGIDRRMRWFDHVLVAGETDREVIVSHGLLPAARVTVVGQVKLAGLRRLGRLERKPLFDNGRPTVLYNPHFHARRGSWQKCGPAVIEAIRDSGRYNLVVAPHVRLMQEASAADRSRLLSYHDPNAGIIADPGSTASIDMTYTLGADIYLADFSSQLYEFLIYPRPCVFIDVIGDGGVDDTRLPEMWALGERISRPAEVVAALDRAVAGHQALIANQEAVVRSAMGDPFGPADELCADLIARI